MNFLNLSRDSKTKVQDTMVFMQKLFMQKLITLIYKIVCALEDGIIVLGAFLDFSKAFDTINHVILLRKLYKYGIRSATHNWLTSYRSNRSQYVDYNNVMSSTKNITCGEQQGSILGPLLFLVYVNDIVNVSLSLIPILFADDTNIFLEVNDINEVIVKMNAELIKVMDWINANKLSLNIEKTNCMVFHTKGRDFSSHVDVTICNKIINRVSYVKFLGVTIDSTLS